MAITADHLAIMLGYVDAPAWQAETVYELGDMVHAKGIPAICRMAGTSGTVEPEWADELKVDAYLETTDPPVMWETIFPVYWLLASFRPDPGPGRELTTLTDPDGNLPLIKADVATLKSNALLDSTAGHEAWRNALRRQAETN
jgi:hypothetical protein